jgi:hypothetical protein
MTYFNVQKVSGRIRINTEISFSFVDALKSVGAARY